MCTNEIGFMECGCCWDSEFCSECNNKEEKEKEEKEEEEEKSC